MEIMHIKHSNINLDTSIIRMPRPRITFELQRIKLREIEIVTIRVSNLILGQRIRILWAFSVWDTHPCFNACRRQTPIF